MKLIWGFGQTSDRRSWQFSDFGVSDTARVERVVSTVFRTNEDVGVVENRS